MTRTSKQTQTSSKTKLMAFAGMLELMRPLGQFTKTEQERLADTLSGIAEDIKKGASASSTIRFIVEVEAEERATT